MIISSKQNDLIKYLNSLKETKNIKREGLCFVETRKVVGDLMKQGLILELFLTEKNRDLSDGFNGKTTFVSNEIAHYLSETKTNDGVFGIAKIRPQGEITHDKVLVLDNVQDPTNVGSIIRSAVAFGYLDIIMIGGAYPYSPKVVRSSMGHVFNVNLFFYTYTNLVDFITKNKYNLIKADLEGENLNTFSPIKPFALAIGNEGQGISDEVSRLSSASVNIPMDSMVESLNASVSAGIIMYEINNKLEK